MRTKVELIRGSLIVEAPLSKRVSELGICYLDCFSKTLERRGREANYQILKTQ